MRRFPLFTALGILAWATPAPAQLASASTLQIQAPPQQSTPPQGQSTPNTTPGQGEQPTAAPPGRCTPRQPPTS